MDRHAVINDKNVVVNVIIWDGKAQWTPPQGHTIKSDEDCYIGDVWHPELGEFVRPMSKLKSPEDETSIAQRKAHYEESKKKLKSSMLFLNAQGLAEV